MDRLENMLKLQQPLLDWFGIYKAGLPKYPVDIESKTGQKTIKDFVANAVEELSEAHEQYQLLYTILSTNGNPALIPKIEAALLEELADVTHFFMDILLCSGIGVDNITRYWERNLRGFDEIDADIDTLDMSFRSVDYNEYLPHDNPSFPFKGEFFHVNYPMLTQQAAFSFDVTHCLYKAMNLLKLRDWRQIEGVDQNEYLEKIMQAWQSFIILLQYMGITSEILMNEYRKKNNINHLRIKDQKANEQNT